MIAAYKLSLKESTPGVVISQWECTLQYLFLCKLVLALGIEYSPKGLKLYWSSPLGNKYPPPPKGLLIDLIKVTSL